MTNYCQNRLTINGSPGEIEAFAQSCLSVHDDLFQLDFEKILPTPTVVKGLYRSVESRLGGPGRLALSAGEVGMEALRRAPLAPVGGSVKPFSVLDHERAKAVGIKSYDDLCVWLRNNDPAALELGRRCLAAQDACGVCFEGDWMAVKWGCAPERIEYEQADLRETSYVANFVSAWSAPEGISREIARRHPGLTIRFAALEEGNDYTFLLTSENGVVNEERPAVSDEFIDELEGAGEVAGRSELEKSYYWQSAVLEPQPMRHIRHWWSEARLKRALAQYPVYRPPHQGIEMDMSEAQARENFAFFLAQKAGRVEGLARFLASFGVSLDFTDTTKGALDEWIATYAGFLYVREEGSSFMTHDPEWDGARLGLNVILDLAIFLGNFAIHESPGLRWDMDTVMQSGRTRTDHRFQRPVLAAAAPLLAFPHDIVDETHQICHSLCEHSYMWKRAMFQYGSRDLARNFATKTLRHLYLCARDDFETANSERAKETYFFDQS